MAISEAGSSHDAAPASRCEYDVFLNFRGEDTRYGFTDFLYDRMVDAGIHVFRDEEELPVGEVIGEELQEAIQNTIIYIPIFSQTYASSKWCLRELVLMVDNVSKSNGQKSIIPIFFHVEPDDVKLKKSLYKADFKKHEEDFGDEVKAWKGALGKVDERKGWVVEKKTSQANIVKSVVKMVLEKLEIKQKLVTEHLIGLDDRVKQLTELLDVDDPDVLLIGIYGMGGIGKTTVSKVIFNQLSSHFGKYCTFLEDVRECSSTKEGMVQLQKKLLSDIVDSEYAEKVKDSEQGMQRIEKTIKKKKVLVVLDDVDNKAHIKQLIGKDPLHSGSRIIITTRNTGTLQVEGFKGRTRLYEMPQMDDDLALQLFYRHAFVNCPSHDYHGLSREIVSSIGGLPLAIEVMGSLLNEKEKAFWDETLLRLRKVPENEIQKKLRISYDCLDKDQQQIFLDIACFFFNEKMNDVIYVWPNPECYIVRAIDVLTSRCLVKILDNGKFWMHNQLIDLGRQIVQEESRSDLGKQSRLWIAKEALKIIESKERKGKVQALEIDGLEKYIKITNEKFKRLENLRFLKLGFGTFVGDFANCCSKLRWISWHSPRDDFTVDNLCFDRLVVFKLDRSDFTDDSKAWNLIKWAKKLKVLSLTRCNGITMIPDFSICSGLERLTLAFCKQLRSVKSFIGDLRSLIELEIKSCTSLTDLPEEVGKLSKLERFSLLGCSELEKLPDSLGNLTSLIELDLSGMCIDELPNSIKGLVNLKTFLLTNTWIKKFPNSIGKLKSLRVLRLPQSLPENQIWRLPSDIGMLTNLEELDLSGPGGLKCGIPVEIGQLSSLRILNLKGTCISGIPGTINRLRHLQTLNLRDCHGIQELPELPTSLTRLLLQSESLRSVPNMSNLTNLVELLLSDGSPSTGKSNLCRGCDLTWIAGLSRLKKLDLYLRHVPAPPELASLFYLEELTLSYLDLTDVQLPSSLLRLKLQSFRIRGVELPSSLNLRKLLTLQLYWGDMEEIRLDGLPRLEHLTVYDCELLKILSIPSGLENLRKVRVSCCPDLEKIEVKGCSHSFGSFTVFECKSLEIIEVLSNINLVKLQIERCDALINVEGLNHLKVLESLQVIDCPSLESLINLSSTKIPDHCLVDIRNCGYRIKDFEMSANDPSANSLEHYRKNIDQFTSKRRSISTSHKLKKGDRTDEGSGDRDGSGSSVVPGRSCSESANGNRRGGR